MGVTDRLRQGQLTQLNTVQVASQCHARWEEMEGDDKVRFCSSCRLHVYNLSAMDVEEAAEVIARDDDRLYIRFYRRADGTILTRDCPVGAAAATRRRRENVANVASTVLAASTLMMILTPTMGARARPSAARMALHSAAMSGDTERLRKILEAWPGLDTRLKSGRTLLMTAAQSGRTKAIRLLLDRGENPNAADREGRTALSLARAAKHRAAIKLLVQAGATM